MGKGLFPPRIERILQGCARRTACARVQQPSPGRPSIRSVLPAEPLTPARRRHRHRLLLRGIAPTAPLGQNQQHRCSGGRGSGRPADFQVRAVHSHPAGGPKLHISPHPLAAEQKGVVMSTWVRPAPSAGRSRRKVAAAARTRCPPAVKPARSSRWLPVAQRPGAARALLPHAPFDQRQAGIRQARAADDRPGNPLGRPMRSFTWDAGFALYQGGIFAQDNPPSRVKIP